MLMGTQRVRPGWYLGWDAGVVMLGWGCWDGDVGLGMLGEGRMLQEVMQWGAPVWLLTPAPPAGRDTGSGCPRRVLLHG